MAWKTEYEGNKAVKFLEHLAAGSVSEAERLAVKKLDLSHNRLSSLPPEIGQLTNLTRLHWSFNNLSSLPSEIGHLANLTSLNLSGNSLSSLPPEIGQLTKLTSLNLSGNRLSSLPPEIGQLTNLTSLNLWRSNLCGLPSEIGQLTKLTSLNFSGNSLNILPPEIGHLTNLTRLDLRHNNLSSLPPEIGQLKKLKYLSLSGTSLDQLPPRLVITWLELGLHFTNEFFSSTGIILYKTILRDQDINIFLSNDVARIRAYCEDLIQQEEQGNMRVCNEARIVFLGNGLAGKTKTIQRILGINTDTAETYGVDFFPWQLEGKDYHFNIWDFGGQSQIRSMHRCFLQNGCLYVLMVRPRNNSGISTMDSVRQWLRMLKDCERQNSRYTGRSSVLLAVNIDRGSSMSNSEIDMESLISEFPNYFSKGSQPIVFCAIHADNDNFDELKNTIIEKASKLDSVTRTLPASAWQIKRSLETMKTPIIEESEVYEMFTAAGISDEDDRQYYLDWFNSLGVYFRYETQKSWSVLDPKWITLALYGLVRQMNDQREELLREERENDWAKGYVNSNGIISQTRILNLLSEDSVKQKMNWTFERGYTSDHIPYILQILRKFNFSYDVGEGKEYIPALCPEQPGIGITMHPDSFDSKLQLKYEYDFISDFSIFNLIVSIYPVLVKNRCFRKKFQVKYRLLTGIVEFEDKTMRITVYRIKSEKEGSSPLENGDMPSMLMKYLREKATSVLGEPTDKVLIYEPDSNHRYKIDIDILDNAISKKKMFIDSKNEITKTVDEVRVADVSGVYVYSSDNDDILGRIERKIDQIGETVGEISDKEDILISMLADLGEENYGFREAVLDELGKNQEILPLIPSLEKELGKGFFRKLFDNVAGNVAATACMAAATKLATSIGPELSQALQIQALQNLPFLP